MLVVAGTDAADVAVPSSAIVERLDVVEEICSSLFTCPIDPIAHALLLQAPEEGLGCRVVEAVAAPAHAHLEVVRLAEPRPSATRRARARALC